MPIGAVLSGISTGVGIANGLYGLGNALFGKKNTGYTSTPNGITLSKNGFVDINGNKYSESYSSSRMPSDYYWQQLMNEYNIEQQKMQSERENQWNRQNWKMQFDETNEYNSPLNQANRLSAAGINPILAMGSNGSIGQAQGSSIAPASQSVGGSIGSAGLASAAAAQHSADVSQLNSSADLLANSIVRASSARKSNAEAETSEIDNLTRNLENLSRIRELKARASTSEEKSQLTRLEKELLDQTFAYKVNQESSTASKLYNETILQGDIHAINQYEKSLRYYQQAIAKANLDWLPKEKQAALATEYARARAYGASASSSIAEAEKYASETLGIKLTNEQRKDLDKAFRNATRDQYKAIKVALNHAKEMLKQAKYDSDHQGIKFWTEQVESYTRSFKNVSSGISSFIP